MQKYLRAAQAALLSWVTLAGAETVPNLYQADVPVAEQSAAELRRAASAGLAEVLVRVSGRADAQRNPALAPALAGADRYLEQYRYERNPAAGSMPWLVRLNFAPDQSERLLRGAGLPVWGGNRPGVLALVVVDDGAGRNLVGDDSPVAAALREQARRRGLALHFPLLDGADAHALAGDDIWQLDAGRVGPALERYKPDALLLGRLTQSGGRWSGSWSLTVNDQHTDAEGEADSLSAALAPSIDKLADALASQYAVASSGAPSEGVLLRLIGIRNFDDYAHALAYLQRLEVVKSANPVQVEGEEVLLRLRIAGSAEQLARQLALDSRLQPQTAQTDSAAGDQSAQLQYRWAPPTSG